MKKQLWIYYAYSICNNQVLIDKKLCYYGESGDCLKDMATDDYKAILEYIPKENIESYYGKDIVPQCYGYIRTKNDMIYNFIVQCLDIDKCDIYNKSYIIRFEIDNFMKYAPVAYSNFYIAVKEFARILNEQYEYLCKTYKHKCPVKMELGETSKVDFCSDVITTKDDRFQYSLEIITPNMFYKPVKFE